MSETTKIYEALTDTLLGNHNLVLADDGSINGIRGGFSLTPRMVCVFGHGMSFPSVSYYRKRSGSINIKKAAKRIAKLHELRAAAKKAEDALADRYSEKLSYLDALVQSGNSGPLGFAPSHDGRTYQFRSRTRYEDKLSIDQMIAMLQAAKAGGMKTDVELSFTGLDADQVATLIDVTGD